MFIKKNGRNNQIHIRLKRVWVGGGAEAGGLIENIHPCMNCVNCVVFFGESDSTEPCNLVTMVTAKPTGPRNMLCINTNSSGLLHPSDCVRGTRRWHESSRLCCAQTGDLSVWLTRSVSFAPACVCTQTHTGLFCCYERASCEQTWWTTRRKINSGLEEKSLCHGPLAVQFISPPTLLPHSSFLLLLGNNCQAAMCQWASKIGLSKHLDTNRFCEKQKVGALWHNSCFKL